MPRRYAGLWLGCLLALRALPGVGADEVRAAEFTVDVTADSDDSSPGDGFCRASSGLCTLRAAVQEANALAGDDVIKLRSGTYILQDDPAPPAAANRGDLDVTGSLTIQPLSGSPIIDGKNASRIFEVTRADPDVPVTLTLQGLTLTGGNATSEPTGLPACGLEGGAVCGVGADVRVIDCTVKGHRGDNGGALFVAGGSLTVDRSDVTGNVATSLGGAIAAQGASVVVTNSTVADNKIDAGGSFGGGMAVYDGATLELTNSTVSGNTAVGTGGGLAITGAGAVAVRNCTFSGNTASGEGGGGIDFRSATSFLLGNATIARNSGGGLKLEGSTGATVRNSLIALNLPNDCNGSADVSANNLLSKSDGCSLAGATLTTDPKLASTLETNGTRNESKTLALLEDSPADNQGAECELTDQRGFTRALACDIGAYERLDDDDQDFVPDGQDNCPAQANADQNDEDRDGIGDVCDCTPKIATTGTPDEDDDGDGVPNRIDCCAATPPPGQDVTCLAGGVGADATGCSVSQACDCTYRMKDGQAYPWGKRKGWKKCVRRTVGKIEGIGKRCKRDISRAIINDPNLASCGKYDGGSGDDDNDGVANAADNCPRVYNPAQENSDEDSEKKQVRGDACDDDDDNDNLPDAEDKCPTVVSCKNEDADSDGLGNECDECPWENNGTGIDASGCEKGQDGKGAVDPPADCKVVDGGGGGGDGDDGDLVDN